MVADACKDLRQTARAVPLLVTRAAVEAAIIANDVRSLDTFWRTLWSSDAAWTPVEPVDMQLHALAMTAQAHSPYCWDTLANMQSYRLDQREFPPPSNLAAAHWRAVQRRWRTHMPNFLEVCARFPLGDATLLTIAAEANATDAFLWLLCARCPVHDDDLSNRYPSITDDDRTDGADEYLFDLMSPDCHDPHQAVLRAVATSPDARLLSLCPFDMIETPWIQSTLAMHAMRAGNRAVYDALFDLTALT
jgi:hypothetical protein